MISSTKPSPGRIADAVTGKRCPICLSRVDIRSAAAIIPCMHAYCVGCIRKWSDVKRNCPLCSANFSCWFRRTGSMSFCEEKLPPLDRGKKVTPFRPGDTLRRWRSQLFEQRRLIGISRRATIGQSHASVLPRQRSFVRAVHEDSDVIAERAKQWRASIYERKQKAVPPQPKNGLMQQIGGSNGGKELLMRRLEPWIWRELEAVLGDPDPTVIVHVVTSLFISSNEKNHEHFPGQHVQIDFLAPLRNFLHEHTELFWHELRCYAESSLSMETYDTVVVYRRME